MKKLFSFFIILLLCSLLTVPALATDPGPVITLQLQNLNYPQYSMAIYTVKADGTNLTATWYIEYEGKTYNASKPGGSMQPWEAYAGESYGARKVDDNTFSFVFEGIEKELDGAKIWCEIQDGHNNVTSQTGYITVGTYGDPPEILSIPTSITVTQGQEAEIRCVAKSTDGSQLDFLWYETESGKLDEMHALNRGTETGDFLFCDTSVVGTRYYLCGITTSGGGMAYSSMVEVTVAADTQPPTEPAPPPTTPTEPTEPTTPSITPTEPTAPSTSPTEPTAPAANPAEQTEPSVAWWVLVLVAVGAAGIGVALVILLSKRK